MVLASRAALLRAAAFGLPALWAVEAGATVRCDVDAKFSCGPAGCGSVAPGVTARIDPERRFYAWCDARGCDKYSGALVSRSGDFVNVALPEHGLLAKLALSDGAFVEVATLGTTTLLSYGRCRAE
jgi:hypothetical protein